MSETISERNPETANNVGQYSRLVNSVVLLAPWVAMVTIIFGALTTTKNAGMAFRDWPTSDGQNMITYPWFSLFGDMMTNRDSLLKFLEHGHRLAGVLIGLVAIAVAGVVLAFEKRRSVKFMGVGILLAVIAQGLLGGFRVELNRRGLATVHGSFAALVFSLMCITGLVTSRSWWKSISPEIKSKSLKAAFVMAALTTVLLMGQYVAGGFLRHHGMLLHLHLTLGVLGLIAGIATAIVCYRTRETGIGRTGLLLGLVVVSQFCLGLGAFVTKYGLAAIGYTAVIDAIDQVIFRTAHMVVGVLVIATATTLLTKIGHRRRQLTALNTNNIASTTNLKSHTHSNSADQPATVVVPAMELKGGLS